MKKILFFFSVLLVSFSLLSLIVLISLFTDFRIQPPFEEKQEDKRLRFSSRNGDEMEFIKSPPITATTKTTTKTKNKLTEESEENEIIHPAYQVLRDQEALSNGVSSPSSGISKTTEYVLISIAIFVAIIICGCLVSIIAVVSLYNKKAKCC